MKTYDIYPVGNKFDADAIINFTPCECNPLSFRVSEYVGEHWQTTYTY